MCLHSPAAPRQVLCVLPTLVGCALSVWAGKSANYKVSSRKEGQGCVALGQMLPAAL